MKKYFSTRLALLIVLLSPVVITAQLTNGDFVTIKNSSSGKYIKAKGIAVDSPIVHGQLNQANMYFGQWKVMAASGGGYMFLTRINGLYLGIKPVAGAGNGFIVQRRLTAENRDELTWILVRTPVGYQLKNKKNNRMLSVQGSLTEENSNLVHTLNPALTGKIWVFTPVTSSPAASTTGTGRSVLFDVTLNYIAVSEATRNRIDNGDCRRVFGQVKTELWELDDNNQKKRRIAAYENKPEYVFNQLNYLSAPTEGLSYYQDNRADAAKNEMEKVTYNIPEDLLNNRKVMLVIKTYLGTRHKDSDLSSYDAVKMKQEKQSTYILDNRISRTETIQAITDRYFNNMTLTGSTINGSLFEQGDDTHKLWVTFTCKKQ
ncbi:MAG: RICIN domain-containing protein [Chitinophagales bacterium]|nr:RICIN domain-containing protein [Chitinophagales bacterium]